MGYRFREWGWLHYPILQDFSLPVIIDKENGFRKFTFPRQ